VDCGDLTRHQALVEIDAGSAGGLARVRCHFDLQVLLVVHAELQLRRDACRSDGCLHLASASQHCACCQHGLDQQEPWQCAEAVDDVLP
jgi:hypothetical protein